MTVKYASFECAGSRFALDVLLVREINRGLEVTPVTPAPAALAGLMNLRGQIVSVIDLAAALGLSGDRADRPWYIVLKTAEEVARIPALAGRLDEAPREPAALLVDRIGEMIEAEPGETSPAPANSAEFAARFVRGVLSRPDGIVMLLAPQEVLAAGSGKQPGTAHP